MLVDDEDITGIQWMMKITSMKALKHWKLSSMKALNRTLPLKEYFQVTSPLMAKTWCLEIICWQGCMNF